jgi:ABC-type polysaccharide/polyol phosphate transport system ATPase subunit
MNKGTVISLQNINKTFQYRESGSSIRNIVFSAFQKRKGVKRILALEEIDLQVRNGEFIGIIGRNGSGKSTLLNIILGTIKPDKGGFRKVNGVVLRLALGMGFDGNLSARENIYLNGSIIGLTFKKIGTIFNDIISFSELEDFVDTPVKYFSSGMRSRLAFSIAVHVEADILLIDEFFGGVGDLAFKSKSEKVFKETILEGKTIIYVSHQLANIQKYSQRVGVMHNGRLMMFEDSEAAIAYYRNVVK